ncbi:hypothetical protein ACJJTC_009154 [Scirpophaga incertulas]
MLATSGAMLRTCCILLCFIAGSRQLSITEFAVPKAVEAGRNAELQCRYSEADGVDYVKWWWTPLYVESEDKNRILIYQRLTGFAAEIPRKNIEGKENDTIVILDLKPSDSGVYECEASNLVEARKHQEMIVFSNGTGIELNVTKVVDGPDEDEDEDVLVQCEARGVTPQPLLVLSVDSNELLNTTHYLSGGEDGLFDIFANVTVSAEDVEDAEIRCELFYEDKDFSHPPYIKTLLYSTGVVSTTTESPEDATQTEVASELTNTNGAIFHGSSWLLAVVVVHLYFLH